MTQRDDPLATHPLPVPLLERSCRPDRSHSSNHLKPVKHFSPLDHRSKLMAASASTSPKVWLITGCSSGFGRELVLAALARGDRVIATARDVTRIADLQMKGAAILELDVTSGEATLTQSVADAVEIYGRLDILVNNAGYALNGAIEETSAKETFDQFNTLVFGALTVSRAVLPFFRSQRSGVIANIGSVVAWRGASMLGVYAGAKAALAALSQSLRTEVAPLGIEVTVVEPGYFRTDILSGRRVMTEASIEDYAPMTRQNAAHIDAIAGKEPGDPRQGAQLIVEALTKTGRCEGRRLPARMPLGKMAVDIPELVLAAAKQELQAWGQLAISADFVDA